MCKYIRNLIFNMFKNSTNKVITTNELDKKLKMITETFNNEKKIWEYNNKTPLEITEEDVK